MSKKDLIERWHVEPELKLVFENLVKLFQKGGGVRADNISVGFVNEKLDLRGIKLNNRKIAGCTFVNIDFSFSSFQNCWIENSFFEMCQFDKVDFSDFSDHQNCFKACSFVGCSFNFAAVGYGGTKFTNCIFENCKFTKTVFNRPEFVDVVFKNCRLRSLDFNAASFQDCSFEGELTNVWFRGGFPLQTDYEYFGKPKVNDMKNVSFENAELHDLTFSNDCDLSTVSIKHSDNYYKYGDWRGRLELLKSKSNSWNDKEKREVEIFVHSYAVHATNQQWHIINKNDVEQEFGKDIALKIINQLNTYQ